jgi:hypothetical protein
MKLETINGIRVITPEADMWLCNEKDKVISDKVYLGINADENEWRDITETEKARLEELWNTESEPTDNEATEADYINALEELGVNFNE